MKYGIYNNETGLFCANCHKKLSNTFEVKENFCSNCGNPLHQTSFQKRLEENSAIRLDVLETIEEANKKGIALSKIIADLKTEI